MQYHIFLQTVPLATSKYYPTENIVGIGEEANIIIRAEYLGRLLVLQMYSSICI